MRKTFSARLRKNLFTRWCIAAVRKSCSKRDEGSHLVSFTSIGAEEADIRSGIAIVHFPGALSQLEDPFQFCSSLILCTCPAAKLAHMWAQEL